MPAAEPRIVYSPRPDATPERELGALTTVYAFVMQRHRSKEATGASGGKNDAKSRKQRKEDGMI